MDYFQGVVQEYLRADRTIFLNPEFALQLDGDVTEPPKGRSWYVDVVAVSFEEETAYLCEVTYAKGTPALRKRLRAWADNWNGIVDAIKRDCHLPDRWLVRPWLFVPESEVKNLVAALPGLLVDPRITTLEMTEPWNYSWDRRGEREKPSVIPPQFH